MNATRECSIEDCHRPHYARGWCKRHYAQAWVHGDHTSAPRVMVDRGASLEERLRHIGWNVTPGGCWEWKGSVNGKGYGQVAVGIYDGRVSRPSLAHRVSYTVFKGDPGNRPLRHTCDNPPCINPDHLIPGTTAENAADMSMRHRNPTGEYRSDAVLSSDDVASIKDRYSSGGVSQRALADEYGCSQQLVSLIVRGLRRTVEPRRGYVHPA